MNLFEKSVSSNTLFTGNIITLKKEMVTLPNGKQASREIVGHPGGVGIVAVDDNRQVLMVRQYRRPFDELVLEIPAGKLNYGEAPRACGIRELEEETGAKAASFEYLGKHYPSPGFCQEIIHIYLATGLTMGDVHPDEDEFLEIEKYPLAELVDMVLENKIYDTKTVIGILKANEILRRQENN